MRTFIIRARKGSTRWEKLRASVGSKEHFEIITHCVINAFFVSVDFRQDTEVYIILDSSEDFPRTIKLSGHEGLSLPGFHESAILDVIEHALKHSIGLQKDATRRVAPGIEISGFGFEKLVSRLLSTRPVYMLDPKGEDIRSTTLEPNPIFILSDHLAMPKKSVQSFKRQGLKTLSLGKKMLFASHCVTILNYELDRAKF